MRRIGLLIVLAMIPVGLIAGCKSKDRMTPDNFSQVRPHASTEAEVVALLGEPEHKLPGLWIYQRPEEHLYVKLEFDDSGRVTRKEWIDGVSGQWQDTADKPAKP